MDAFVVSASTATKLVLQNRLSKMDAFVVKYVYPAFTPTVGLFLAGAAFYGGFKIQAQRKPYFVYFLWKEELYSCYRSSSGSRSLYGRVSAM